MGRGVPHHPTKGLGERFELPSGVRAEPRPKIDFVHISGQKEAIWNTLFSIFERWRGPLNVAGRGPGKLSPLSAPLDGPAEFSAIHERELITESCE